MTDIRRTKRTGRPSKQPKPGERMSLGLKVTADIKGRLDHAARESGRTQSQEAEARLERSFDREDLLSEALRLAYGEQLAGILMLLGTAMQHALNHAIQEGVRNRSRWIGELSFGQIADTAREVLQAIPPGPASRPDYASVAQIWGWDKDRVAALELYHREKPRTIAAELVDTVRGQPRTNWFEADAEKIRDLLGGVVDQLSSPPTTAELAHFETEKAGKLEPNLRPPKSRIDPKNIYKRRAETAAGHKNRT